MFVVELQPLLIVMVPERQSEMKWRSETVKRSRGGTACKRIPARELEQSDISPIISCNRRITSDTEHSKSIHAVQYFIWWACPPRCCTQLVGCALEPYHKGNRGDLICCQIWGSSSMEKSLILRHGCTSARTGPQRVDFDFLLSCD